MSKLTKTIESLKRLFVPHYTDKKVAAIHTENQKLFTESAVVAERYNKMLKKNGVTMRIAIASGHADKGHQ